VLYVLISEIGDFVGRQGPQNFFQIFLNFMFTAAGRAVYTCDLVKTVNMGNPYNFLADSVFAVVRGVVLDGSRA